MWQQTRAHTDTHTHTTVKGDGFQRRLSFTIFFTNLFRSVSLTLLTQGVVFSCGVDCSIIERYRLPRSNSISYLQILSDYYGTLYHIIVLKYDSRDNSKISNTDDRYPCTQGTHIHIPKFRHRHTHPTNTCLKSHTEKPPLQRLII